MSYGLSNEIKQLLDGQPRLTIVDNDIEYLIQGVYKYSLDYDGHIAQGERNIKLTVQKTSQIAFQNFMYTIIQNI